MTLRLYSTLGSPAVRSTLLTIRALGLKDQVTIIPIDLFKSDNFKPEFLEKNPLHTVPVLEDGDFVLWESHAINAYLVNKYAKNDGLYPKDPQKRALVDSMAHFDTGYLFARALEVIKAVFTQDTAADLKKLTNNIQEVLDFLETILEKRIFVAGDQMTIADFSIVASLSTAEVFLPLDPRKYPRIAAWYEKMKELPYFVINQKGLEMFKAVFTALRSKL